VYLHQWRNINLIKGQHKKLPSVKLTAEMETEGSILVNTTFTTFNITIKVSFNLPNNNLTGDQAHNQIIQYLFLRRYSLRAL
jgi:hypothetical protein